MSTPKQVYKLNKKDDSDLIIMVDGRKIYVHWDCLRKKSNHFEELYERYARVNLKITNYNYETIYAFLSFMYTGEVLRLNKTVNESLFALSIAWNETSLREYCIRCLEMKGISKQWKFFTFSPQTRRDFCDYVPITGKNVKSLMQILNDQLKERCSRYLLDSFGKLITYKLYQWAKKYGFDEIAQHYIERLNPNQFSEGQGCAALYLACQAHHLTEIRSISNSIYSVRFLIDNLLNKQKILNELSEN